MRPVVSYDDITLPYDSVSAVVQETSRIVAHNNNRTSTTNKSSSSKKRKRKSRHSAAATSGHHGITGNNNNFNGEEDEDAVYLEVEESRELTHDEIWDDSALIEAWNAAAEEYKAYHGPDKGWKNEPVHKSPLWYNTPPPSSKKQKTSHPLPPSVVDVAVTASVKGPVVSTGTEADIAIESDSKPIDFATFVPTHDAGLSLPGSVPRMMPEGSNGISKPDLSSHHTTALSSDPGPMVSQDEAFKRALEATYWSGYWTAVYHCQNQKKATESKSAEDVNTEELVDAGERGDEISFDAEMMDNDVKAILDISNDSTFEGEVDSGDGEGNGGGDEDGENDSLASSTEGDLVSTQR
ncbi:hypothetical protein C8R41DRAFT_842796 [Lentinula lateritia]|uniref:Survival Motor Neuron Gemin2-binding domain-containing protein n=1 Tax=Lentinula lateritia TaxID=40482 RepID=A0ABQ8V8N0_9AGAR|nr:hypothetical protein C8R41DRAFT_842796 [Lentinula lateritia]